MPIHQIRQGEHLARIAREYGFTDPDYVWERGDNQALRDTGRTPATLAPGDLVTIPEKATRTIRCGTERRHRIQLKQRTYRLHLVLRDAQGRPAGNLPCTITAGSEERTVTTALDGSIDTEIPTNLEVAEVIVGDCDSPLSGTRLSVLVGHLDPVALIFGQEARLNNLGYRAGSAGDPSTPAFRSAVEEFQCDHGLAVDGVCGPNTRNKLVEIHGC